MTILRDSALYAPTFDKKLTRMLEREYSKPNFPTKHLLKDMRLFASVAEESGLERGVLEALVKVIETTVVTKQLGDTDYSAVYEGIREPPHD
jgi:3-hydroxyisobutyrate dehydrogenase